MQEYYETLLLFSEKKYERIDFESGINLEKIEVLIDQGCLSGSNLSDSGCDCYGMVSITPHGAVVLAEWKAILDSKSIKGQFMAALGKIVWIIVGMVFTVAGALLIKILQ